MGEVCTSLGDRAVRSDSIYNITSVATNPSECAQTSDATRPGYYPVGAELRDGTLGNESKGFRWADGRLEYAAVQTILPPNKPSCFEAPGAGQGEDRSRGISTMGSHHTGGAHALLGDGAIKFVTDSIEAGNVASPYAISGSKSPFGLWGALGTRGSHEVIVDGI